MTTLMQVVPSNPPPLSLPVTLPPPSPLSSLEALRRLDAVLLSLVNTAEERGGVAAAALRGMFVAAEEAVELLSRTPGAPGFDRLAIPPLTAPGSKADGFARLAALFDLTTFDTDLLLIALAPEIDLRYERIYGFLQDDTTRRRATVDLALNLRTATPAEKLARLAHLTADAPLLRHGLVRLAADPAPAPPPLLGHTLIADPLVVDWLLGRTDLDSRLTGWCRIEPPVSGSPAGLPTGLAALAPSLRDRLGPLTERAASGAALTLHLHGPQGVGRCALAAALACALARPLLTARPALTGESLAACLSMLARAARLRGAVLAIAGIDTPIPAEAAAALRAMCSAAGAVVVLMGREPWVAGADDLGTVIDVALTRPDSAARRALWAAALALPSEASVVADLAARFRLGAGQIARAARDAALRAVWDGAGLSTPAYLFAAASAQSGRALATLAPKVTGVASWNDLVLPDEQAAQLREFCEQARWRHHVLGAWGFGRMPVGTRGLNGLFAGPPGTGKTMAASVIASDLGLDLYRIDLAQVVSKYIGETQQNLDRIFRAAADANAVLLFDEAEALFGARSEVRDAHDRYANIEVAYLLQKMEDHDGITILATNLRQNLDAAFLRRLHAVVEFPFPEAAQRLRIWQVTFPSEAPLAADVAFDVLAREIRLAGGNIRNIAMAAAVRAAADGGAIGMCHLLAAARREHQKLGRAWVPPEAAS
jgi:AAA+ superfamily predicted ATPase